MSKFRRGKFHKRRGFKHVGKTRGKYKAARRGKKLSRSYTVSRGGIRM